MTGVYMEKYKAVGVGYSEVFNDMSAAKAAILQQCKSSYRASTDSNLFSLSFSELIGNESECISEFNQSIAVPANARIRVTDIMGVTDTVLFCNLMPYLQKRANTILEKDLSLWGVWRMSVNTESSEEILENVYVAILSDVGGL